MKNIVTKSEIAPILKIMDIKHLAKKRFGQNFLEDHQVLRDMVSAISPKQTDNLVEIGPGLGALTRYLLDEIDQITVIEIDRDLVNYLKKEFSSDQLTIHSNDALKFDFTSLVKANQRIRVVGNLPYNISTPLLFHLFDQIDSIEDMHFLLQKEVVQRITAPVGSTHYGRLSVMSQYYCAVESLFDVGPDAFNPHPQVNSAYLRLMPHRPIRTSASNIKQLEYVVREAFNHRRKTIGNSLKHLVTTEMFADCQINPKKRPQELSVEEYISLSHVPLAHARGS